MLGLTVVWRKPFFSADVTGDRQLGLSSWIKAKFCFTLSIMVTTMIQRPKKLALVVALFIISIVISTYVSTSSSHGPSKFRTHLQQMPAYLRQKACLMSPFGVNQSSGFMEGAVSVNDIVRYSTKSSQGNYMPPEFVSSSVNQAPRVKAAFIVLVRNNELDGMIQSMNDCKFDILWCRLTFKMSSGLTANLITPGSF